MVEPITTAIISGVISAGINAFAAWKKGEISEEQYRAAIKAAKDLELKLKALRPDETWQDINPELFKEAAKYSPDIASFVEENAPQIIREAGASEQKQIQRQALRSYAAQAETGRDVVSEAQREQALYEADARSKQRQQALLERMRQQGMLGSGAALAAQLQTEQATAQEARQESLRGVQEAEMRRRQSLGQAAELAGQMRNQEFRTESSNVETMNAFNQRLANARNLYNQYASNERNRAQLENQRRQAAVEQANIELRNKYAMYNKEKALEAKDRARQFDIGLVNRMYDITQGAENQRAQAKAQQYGDYATALASGIGTGIQAYGIANAANAAKAATAASGAATDFWKGLGQSALQGAAQGLTSSAVSSSMPQPRYNLGVDYNRPDMYEDVSNESYDLGGGRMESQPSATRSTYSTQSTTIPDLNLNAQDQSEMVYDPKTDSYISRNKLQPWQRR